MAKSAKTQKWYKEKAVELAKTLVKQRANYVCEKCGSSREATGKQMHGAHIMPVTWAATAADPYNLLCLCASCHSMGPNSSHQNPIPFGRWFDEKFPGRFDALQNKAVTYSQTRFPKIDWEEVYNNLKNLVD